MLYCCQIVHNLHIPLAMQGGPCLSTPTSDTTFVTIVYGQKSMHYYLILFSQVR